ncbi:hypothetical protein KFL_002210160 [Klebsormidium nitens]|uniref:DUF72 domain-containing protein n=1 Tax=Klebsormidium nitens TaxID=105231 RepID=A0A1Y1I7M9_KLENI|nr:hypothetical protein KFL_002210160 [Klebsormidium nitens]|eukprot:GAQ85151.1 hypothetical protein KFL_002210160 [Klebsormidium nitens]
MLLRTKTFPKALRTGRASAIVHNIAERLRNPSYSQFARRKVVPTQRFSMPAGGRGRGGSQEEEALHRIVRDVSGVSGAHGTAKKKRAVSARDGASDTGAGSLSEGVETAQRDIQEAVKQEHWSGDGTDLASEEVGIAGERRMSAEGGREQEADVEMGNEAGDGKGESSKGNEDLDSEEEAEAKAAVAKSNLLESFRFEGAAKRRKGEKPAAEHRKEHKRKDEPVVKLENAPTMSGSANPAIESAFEGGKEDEMRFFRQLLKQRLPPPVQPFGAEGGTLYVGTSGWDYKDWKGPVYPEKLSKKDWFSHYCSVFSTVEVNNTFYRLPAPEVFAAWGQQAPEGFTYALKFSRFGSHMKKLTDPQGTVGLFVERASHLGGSLAGPVLVQLPPRFSANAPRLDAFLSEVPRGARWAVEMRDPSWLCEDVYAVLRRHNAALCIHDHEDTVRGGPHPKVLTADWSYVRYHGPGGNYRGGYDREFLAGQAEWIRGLLSEGKDVYAYFNNDVAGHAFFDAQELRSGVQGKTLEPR